MYTSFFGLAEKPFNITPDPRFFYGNPLYNEVYANLLYAVKERKGFVALTGEVGTGKTTLVRKLMDDLALTARFVYFYNTNLTFDELLSFICEELALQTSRRNGRVGQIRALNQFLLDLHVKAGTGVLVIDEAQNLDLEVLENLRLLSNIETGTEKLLQIVLVGQPELKAKLDRPQLRQLKQRIPIYCRLDNLKQREVGPYIKYRLQAAGCTRELFTADAIRKIARYSAGTPRLINVIADNGLLIAFGTRSRIVTGEIIDEVAQDMQSGAECREALPARVPVDESSPRPARDALNGAPEKDVENTANIEPTPKIEVTTSSILTSPGIFDRLRSGEVETAQAEHPRTAGKNVPVDNGKGASAVPPGSNLAPVAAEGRGGEHKPPAPDCQTSVEAWPAEEVIFRARKEPPDPEVLIGLAPVERNILKALDGARNVQGIAHALGLSYVTTARALHRLMGSGLVETVPQSPAPDPLPKQAVALLDQALTEAMGPMARVVIQDALSGLGCSANKLSDGDFHKLVEIVSSEILNDMLRERFKTRMLQTADQLRKRQGQTLREFSGAAGPSVCA
ncbi:MAG TPA: AAA family ATPase [Candidatus Eisenbacteria bacterium]|nr:AAA family ATPase [Candidatus Eisenbacteria bacterium]